MARRRVGPQFTFTNDPEILPDGTEVRTVLVYFNGKAAHSRRIGRVWKQAPYGWVAAPPPLPGVEGPDTWSAEVDRSLRHFRTERDACMTLYGVALGVGAVKAHEAIQALPWNQRRQPPNA